MEKISFSHSYGWEILDGFPPYQTIINFPEDKRRDSVSFVVEIIPVEGNIWIGNFSGSGLGYSSSVFPTPNNDVICVNSEGIFYFVNSIFPSEFFVVPIVPIVEIFPSYEYNCMILVGFNKVAFYDTNGLKWVTKVSHDGIKITKINRENIIGFAWDPSKDQNVEFEIDVETGVSKGGSGL